MLGGIIILSTCGKYGLQAIEMVILILSAPKHKSILESETITILIMSRCHSVRAGAVWCVTARHNQNGDSFGLIDEPMF